MYNKTHTDTSAIVVRLAGDEDRGQLSRLAQLDSARLPSAPVLAAFAGERALAAISVSDGGAVADPFRRTAEIVAMLEARLEQIRARCAAGACAEGFSASGPIHPRARAARE